MAGTARATAMVAGVLACVIATAACSTGDDDAAEPPTETTVVTVTASSSRSADPTPSSPADTGGSEVSAPTSTGSAGGIPAGTATPVDAAAFAGTGGGGDGYFFQSPTGNVSCALGLSIRQIPAGCQTLVSLPTADGPTCRNGGNSVYASEFFDGAVRSRCVNQPFYVGGSANASRPGPRVLEYGQSLTVADTTCVSQRVGVSCRRGDVGFLLARDRNELYR